MLELRNITKKRGGRPVIAGLSLSLPAGGMVCLTGSSGVGKSTVLEIAAGLLAPDKGSREFKAKNLSYAFQADVLIPWRTAAQNLEFVHRPGRGAAGRQERIETWLRRFGLYEAKDKYPSQISGGMRRRLNLARAFSLEPELLILDEPFAFLDRRWLDEIACFLAEAVSRQTAVLMASHQMEPLAGLGCRRMEITGPGG